MTDPKITALATHLEVAEDTISWRYGEVYEVDDTSAEYMVLTDSEADTMWDESLDNYIDECILPEAPSNVFGQYFDREAWKRDARHDGRGHCLSSYDGEEHEVELDVTCYYIYRTN